MENPETKPCPLCGYKLAQISPDGFYSFVDCPVCGRVKLETVTDAKLAKFKNVIAIYLFYHKNLYDDIRTYFLIDSKNEEEINKYPWVHNVSLDELRSFSNISFSEKIDYIILNIAKRSKFMGDRVKYTEEEFLSLLFVKRYNQNGESYSNNELYNQRDLMYGYLYSNDYVSIKSQDEKGISFFLSSEGWKRVDKLQKENINNKNVFVSMSFNDETKDTREAIRQGIINAEFSPEFIDEIIHNKQIVPEMFRLIRESRFLILEISDPNYGAYYEAGYALGLGKEVIITCNKNAFRGKNDKYTDEEIEKFKKYLVPHFDIAQKQILIWDDYEDLTKKLEEWIKALF